MKFSRYVAAAALVLAAAGTASVAHARGDVYFSVGAQVSPGVHVGVSNGYYPQPVYVQPQPYYVQPRPIYVQPAPVYYAPAPVYVRPAPVYYSSAPVYYGATAVYYGGHRHHRHHRHHNWN